MAEVGEKVPDRQKKVFEIFRQSYFVSQGFPNLQHHLFQWLAEEKLVTLEDVETTPNDQLKNLYAPRIHSETGQRNESNHGDPLTRWIELQKVLKRTESYKTPPAKDSLLNLIFSESLTGDLFFQLKGRKGRGEQNDVEADGPHDIHKSFMRSYLLKGAFQEPPFSLLFEELRPQLIKFDSEYYGRVRKDSPTSEFRSLYDYKKQYLLQWIYEQTIEKRVVLLVNFWEENHPGHKFFGE